MITYYDIGLNLFCRQYPDPDEVLRNAEAAGVACILTGTEMRENRRIDSFIPNRTAWGTCGIHPHNADRAKREDFAAMEELLIGNRKLVAVGECGLDYDRMFSGMENQLLCLERHIELAERLHRPLFLHERGASDAFVRCFRQHRTVCSQAVVHCFTGDRKTLERYLEMGFFIGITGWICDDRRAEKLREAVRVLPLDRVLLETDSPYLTPRGVKGLGHTNYPENIRYVASALAGYMDVPEESLLEAARENTRRLFRI